MQQLSMPFPYFGAKRQAAPLVWQALGDPDRYIEPFCGTASVLLARPHARCDYSEVINDASGAIVNTLRSIQYHPDKVAKWCRGPICEAGIHAYGAWLHGYIDKDFILWLEGDPEHCDPKAAARFIVEQSATIGGTAARGPWRSVDGVLTKGQPNSGIARSIPNTSRRCGVFRASDDIAATMEAISRRLERVCITCGDWRRVVKPSVTGSGSRRGNPSVGIFLDPPYATSPDVYPGASADISAQVRRWCLEAPAEYRIVLCGYLDECDELLAHGWRKVAWTASRGRSSAPGASRRERLWLSPSRLGEAASLIAS